jgi:DNA-binding NtrC family response regulator
MRIIIAEDDEWYAKFIEYNVNLMFEWDITVVGSFKALEKELHSSPDIISLDYNLPDIDGKSAMEKIKKKSPRSKVIVVSGQSDVKTAMSLLNSGADEYIVKDTDTKERLWQSLQSLASQIELEKRVESLENEVKSKFDTSKSLIGNHPSFTKIHQLINKANKSNINISISGETGSGKEMVAKAIHYNSSASSSPFQAVNLSALPYNLIESELFGHEKGAFTGADKRRIGKLEAAKDGTLFLDEIAEIPHDIQVKLLRVLQEREFQRVGSNDTIKLSCRILTATHKNLLDLIEKGKFRQDLYYRLVGLPIHLPALRERGNDILLLSKYFIESFSKDNNTKMPTLSENARQKLLNHVYPGNVRELKSIIDLACVLCENNSIEPHDITFQSSGNLENILNANLSLKEINERIIMDRLHRTNNNIKVVANELGIGKSTIYRMLKEIE